MDTFSLDENGNVSIFDDLPAYQSTPKASRKRPKTIAAKFVCSVCQKEYQKEFYYKKHLASHNQTPQGKVMWFMFKFCRSIEKKSPDFC